MRSLATVLSISLIMLLACVASEQKTDTPTVTRVDTTTTDQTETIAPTGTMGADPAGLTDAEFDRLRVRPSTQDHNEWLDTPQRFGLSEEELAERRSGSRTVTLPGQTPAETRTFAALDAPAVKMTKERIRLRFRFVDYLSKDGKPHLFTARSMRFVLKLGGVQKFALNRTVSGRLSDQCWTMVITQTAFRTKAINATLTFVDPSGQNFTTGAESMQLTDGIMGTDAAEGISTSASCADPPAVKPSVLAALDVTAPQALEKTPILDHRKRDCIAYPIVAGLKATRMNLALLPNVYAAEGFPKLWSDPIWRATFRVGADGRFPVNLWRKRPGEGWKFIETRRPLGGPVPLTYDQQPLDVSHWRGGDTLCVEATKFGGPLFVAYAYDWRDGNKVVIIEPRLSVVYSPSNDPTATHGVWTTISASANANASAEVRP